MSVQSRRERERAQRHHLIVTAARELAEAEGWDAVTTRRLAAAVEYSQPVLYSHFARKDDIARAVAVEGFGELAAELRRARLAAPSAAAGVRAVAWVYLDFAATRPALYEAMFIMPTALVFGGTSETAEPLRAAFVELAAALEPLTGDRDLQLYAEVVWAGLHGMATLTRDGRLRPDQHQERVTLLLDQLLGSNRGAGRGR